MTSSAPDLAAQPPAAQSPSAQAPALQPPVARDPAPRPAPPAEAPAVFRGTHPPGAAEAPAGAASVAPAGSGWWTTALTCAVVSFFAVLIVSGRVVTEGPVLLTLTATHGVHAGDLLVLCAWALACSTAVARSTRLQRASRARRQAPRSTTAQIHDASHIRARQSS